MLGKLEEWSSTLQLKASNGSKIHKRRQVSSVTQTLLKAKEALSAKSRRESEVAIAALNQVDSSLDSLDQIEEISNQNHLKELANTFMCAHDALKQTHYGMKELSYDEYQNISKIMSHKSNYDYFWVLDLELTCQTDNSGFLMEVIEIGIAVVDTKTLRVVDEFETLVKPICNPNLSDFCTKLTGITQRMVDAADEYPVAHSKMLEFLSKYPNGIFSTYGGGDMKTLIEVCERYQLSTEVISNEFINQKVAFSWAHGGKRCGLKKAINVAKLEITAAAHRALPDARHTAYLWPHIIAMYCVLMNQQKGAQ
ncbi:TPA: exonuclease domain-containing protein [Vibrio vulnificus]|uniref:Exonuclease domain-containing protein n=1 Tax=Vibrio vulnificus TaxID=672 RepID=A0A8H9K6U5_VIBVL|nr:exonuclease domain-containing protein [Vibrio vulnificus]